MTVTDISPRASRPALNTEPLKVVPKPREHAPTSTHSYSIIEVNEDTEIEAKRLSTGTVSVKFRCPMTGSVTQLDLPEADLLRLWMHAETARRSEVGA